MRILPDCKAWSVPRTVDNTEKLSLISCESPAECRPAAAVIIPQEYAELEPLPLNVELYQHQRNGYGLACEVMEIFSKPS